MTYQGFAPLANDCRPSRAGTGTFDSNGLQPRLCCRAPSGLKLRWAIPSGSAIKLCQIAEGIVDVYPRLAPVSEWDVAAGDAIITSAGGAVSTPGGEPLAYGRSDQRFIVPSFVAFGDQKASARLLRPA